MEYKLVDGQIRVYETGPSITITSGETWPTRLWYLVSNPFLYLFAGKIRY